MKKFTDINNNELLRNQINNKLKLYLSINCEFCQYEDRYLCENMVNDKEEEWLATEFFLTKGWKNIKTIEKQGLACPKCVEKWYSGNWYDS